MSNTSPPTSAVHRIPAELMWEVIWQSKVLSHRDVYNLCSIRPFSDAAHLALYRRIPRNLHDHFAAARYIGEKCSECEGSTLALISRVLLPESGILTEGAVLSTGKHTLSEASPVKRIIIRSPFYQEGFSDIDIQNYALLNISQHYPLSSLEAFESHGIHLCLPFLSFLNNFTSKNLSKLILDITEVPPFFDETTSESNQDIQAKLTSILKTSFPNLKSLGLSLSLPPALIYAIATNRDIEEVILFDHSHSRWPTHIQPYGGFSQMQGTLEAMNAAGVSETVVRSTVSYNGMYYGDFGDISRAFPRLRELTLHSRSDFFEQSPNELASKLKAFKDLNTLTIQGTFTPTTQLPPEVTLADSDQDSFKALQRPDKISVNLAKQFHRSSLQSPPAPAPVQNLFRKCEGLDSFRINITLERRVDGSLEALLDVIVDAILKPSSGFQTGWS